MPRTKVPLKDEQKISQGDFTLVSEFKGFRAREDITNLPPGYLVTGSQNVRTNTASRLAIRGGFTLDGQSNATIAPILSAYDFHMHTGSERHLRAGNGKLQYRYVATAGDVWSGHTFTQDQVYWIDLMTGLSSVNINFETFWDFNVELKTLLLFVNGENNINVWTGGLATKLSASTNAIAITGGASLVSFTGSTTTSGNVFSYSGVGGVGSSGSFIISNQPANGDTLTLVINGTSITVTFVSVIGAVAGNVLIGATAANTRTNLIGLLSAPGTTNATQVALSAPNQTLVGYSTYGNANTLTKTGTTTWAQESFLQSGIRSVSMNGNNYQYSGGEGTLTLTFTSDNPSVEPAQSVVQQTVRVTTSSSFTGLPTSFPISLIGNLQNQIYVASLTNNSVYVSKVNSYTDYSYTTPVRKVGDGAILTLDGTPVALIAQESEMYITAGLDQWYQTNFQLSSDNANEALTVQRLKTGPKQAAKTQASVFKGPNNVAAILQEPAFAELGRVTGIFISPQTSNISDPIRDVFNNLDFSNASGIYFQHFYYLAIPANNTVLIWNIERNFWEAPQIMPISRFSIIDGELYGHSYQTPQTFKLFTGYNDNGGPIDARAVFSYMNFGSRTKSKYFNEWYTEGYIAGNTTLTLGVQYEIDGCATQTSYPIIGSDTQIVCIRGAGNSLGKSSLGKNPLGGLNPLVSTLLPPKMRGIKTFPRNDFFEMQPSYSSLGVDLHWELIAFGPRVTQTQFGNNSIKQ